MKEVLIIQAARLGDLLQTRRLALSLQRDHHVHLAVDHSLVPLARVICPGATPHGLSFHTRPTAEVWQRDQQVLSLWEAAGFDAIYNCNFSALTGSLCRMFAPERVIGYRPLDHSAGGLRKSPWLRLAFRLAAHRALASLNLVDLWAHLLPSPVEPQAVNPPAKPGGGGAGVALAGRLETRSMPLPALAQVVDLLAGLYPRTKVKLFGTREQLGLASRLLRLVSPRAAQRVHNLCGKTTLLQACNEIRGLDVLVTPDTGLMHLSACLGVPVLAFFFASAWAHETGPYGLGHTVIQTTHTCSPCSENQPCQAAGACSRFFNSSEFLTCVARILKGSPVVPQGVQVWRTGFDSLGARLELVAGSDEQAEARKALRNLVAEFLGQGTSCTGSPPNALLAELVWPESEWMFPPWHYV